MGDELPGRPERPTDPEAGRVWDAASRVLDPEIPVLTITDLGMLREVRVEEPGRSATLVITPTYSGCPAMEMIARQVREAVEKLGYTSVDVRTVLSPAWSTDWMAPDAKTRLEAYGIAPPTARAAEGPVLVQLGTRPDVRCPRCSSHDVKELSRFGSTSCKALYQCRSCAEPFDYFKVL